MAVLLTLVATSALLVAFSSRLVYDMAMNPAGFLGRDGLTATVSGLLGLGLVLVNICLAALVVAERSCIERLASAMERQATWDTPEAVVEGGSPALVRLARAINMTKRRHAEQVAEHLEVQAAFAHDLRTPLTRISLRCELLEDLSTSELMARDLAEMNALVEGTIASARTLRGVQEVPRSTDADELLLHIIAGYREAGHRVDLEGRIGQPIRTYPLALRRVLANLIDNALSYAGDVRLLVRTDDRSLVLAVVDSGPGIAPVDLEKVFSPWYRAPHGSRRTTGNGLGLAIARRLAVAMHSDLQLENRPSGGLEARLTLSLIRD